MTPDERQVFERLHELVLSQLEGQCSQEQQRELAQLLRDHPWAEEIYVESIQDAASLRWWSANAPVSTGGRDLATIDPVVSPFPRRLRASVPLLAALAASILVAVAAGVVSHFRHSA